MAVPGDFRTARASLAADHRQTVRYAGTVDGLAGLIADIELAGVADGVTLIPVGPRQDLRGVGRDVLNRLALRVRASCLRHHFIHYPALIRAKLVLDMYRLRS